MDLRATRARRRTQPIPWIPILFFCSGFPALIYQIVWERALFTAFGMNIQSVTLVVSAFMLGLGIGSLAGGALSNHKHVRLVVLFSICELGTAIFGLFSLKLFHYVAERTAQGPLLETGLVCFALIVAPTVLMGATLPLLVEHLVRSSHNMGRSVGQLYFVNTLGSGFACFVAGGALMRFLGQTGSVRVAACMNVVVAFAALIYSWHSRQEQETVIPPEQLQQATSTPVSDRLMPFSLALFCSAFCGFVALSYEIIWYRLISFAIADTAATFATLLGTYLFGIAFGSRLIERYARRRSPEAAGHVLGGVIAGSVVLAFSVGPAFAILLKLASPNNTQGNWPTYLCMLVLVLVGAAFFGASFPLIAYASTTLARHPGVSLSYLYAAHIVGSTLGTLVVGFVLMDHFSLFQISSLLLIGGVVLSIVVVSAAGEFSAVLKPRFVATVAIVAGMVVFSRPVFATLYDRLIFKNQYPEMHFQQIVENRSGTIGVTPDGVVFGGGVYDGRFNTDLLHDVNWIVRPFGLSAFHAAPHKVLMIGLGSGSWAQVVANHPQLENLTVVEINPGYLEIVPKHAAVASLLQNPKVHIVIDDGRQWLIRNPGEKFDAIVMNTTFHWRNHISNLLSVEFLRIVRQHLLPGGVLLYNTTSSEDVMAT